MDLEISLPLLHSKCVSHFSFAICMLINSVPFAGARKDIFFQAWGGEVSKGRRGVYLIYSSVCMFSTNSSTIIFISTIKCSFFHYFVYIQ